MYRQYLFEPADLSIKGRRIINERRLNEGKTLNQGTMNGLPQCIAKSLHFK